MSDGMPYADIVLLALIAGFVLLRLRSVLGQNIGRDPVQPEYRKVEKAEQESSVFRKPDTIAGDFKEVLREEKDEAIEALPAPLRETVAAIRARDSDFTVKSFMEGARGAFEMIFDAFNENDRDTLKMLLSPELYTTFARELDQRTAAAERGETTLLALLSQEMAAASLTGPMARITVRFVSEQVSVVRDAAGAIIDGDPSHPQHVEDEWVFERDTGSRNPNWTIIDT